MNSFIGAKITGYNNNSNVLEPKVLNFSGKKIRLSIRKAANKIKLIVNNTEFNFDKLSIEELNSRALLIIDGNVNINIKNLTSASIFQFNTSEVCIENVVDSKLVLMDDSTCKIKNFNTGSSLNQRINSTAHIENFYNYSQINIWEDSKYTVENENNGSLINHKSNIKYDNICETRWLEFVSALGDSITENIKKAYLIAKSSHKDQLRDCGTPYICHPINVAMIIANELGIKDEEILITALLHDVAEDTPFTLDKIKEEFGSKIANNVKYLTKPDNYFGNKDVQVQFYSEVRNAPELVQIIKLSDRLDNLRDLSWVNIGKIKRQIISTKNKYLEWAKGHSPYIHNEMLNLLDNYYKKIDYKD